MEDELIERAFYHKDIGSIGMIKLLMEILDEKRLITKDEVETKIHMNYGAV